MTENRILRPGINCWRIGHADRVSFLVDGAEYFHAFREAAKNAQYSIIIVGWDINSRFKLERTDPKDGLPTSLADFLNTLVRKRKKLRVNILDWDFPMIFAADREWFPQYKLDWTTSRRLHFFLDNQHPVGASHHQKIVVIDDRIAFVGGLDFTLGRWDTSEHRPDDTRRIDYGKHIPQPYHDMQIMAAGGIAQFLGELARKRWQTATGKKLLPPEPLEQIDSWPSGITPDVEQVEIGIARTYPGYNYQDDIREIEQLLVDAITRAHHTIYIENQYFTAQNVGDALAKRLEEDNGPEIVVVLPQQTVGWLSQHTMDVLRERMLKRLYQVDHKKRMRVYYPHVPGLGKECINVHSKVLIIDDEFIRVGSANFNNRSMGLDTECDLAIEARGMDQVRNAFSDLRNCLLAEHLDVDVSVVKSEIEKKHSMIQAIESLQHEGRTLKPLPLRVPEQLDAFVPDTSISDPEEAIDSNYLSRQLVPDEDKPQSKHIFIMLSSLLMIIILLAASWRWTALGEWVDINTILASLTAQGGHWLAPLVVSLIFIVGGLIIFPVTLMIIATGLTFGAYYGFFYALLGAELSAIVTYLIGHSLGHNTLRRLSHRWVVRISRRLAKQGILAIITLRVIPVAPFSVINLVAGASHIGFRDFALGTLLGLVPGILAFTLFADQVTGAIQSPETVRIATLAGLAVVIAAGTWALSRWLLRRQNSQTRPE